MFSAGKMIVYREAMDGGCYLRNCTQITSQSPHIKNQCQVPVTVHEDLDGCKTSMLFLSRPKVTDEYWIGLNELPGGGNP